MRYTVSFSLRHFRRIAAGDEELVPSTTTEITPKDGELELPVRRPHLEELSSLAEQSAPGTHTLSTLTGDRGETLRNFVEGITGSGNSLDSVFAQLSRGGSVNKLITGWTPEKTDKPRRRTPLVIDTPIPRHLLPRTGVEGGNERDLERFADTLNEYALAPEIGLRPRLEDFDSPEEYEKSHADYEKRLAATTDNEGLHRYWRDETGNFRRSHQYRTLDSEGQRGEVRTNPRRFQGRLVPKLAQLGKYVGLHGTDVYSDPWEDEVYGTKAMRKKNKERGLPTISGRTRERTPTSILFRVEGMPGKWDAVDFIDRVRDTHAEAESLRRTQEFAEQPSRPSHFSRLILKRHTVDNAMVAPMGLRKSRIAEVLIPFSQIPDPREVSGSGQDLKFTSSSRHASTSPSSWSRLVQSVQDVTKTSRLPRPPRVPGERKLEGEAWLQNLLESSVRVEDNPEFTRYIKEAGHRLLAYARHGEVWNFYSGIEGANPDDPRLKEPEAASRPTNLISPELQAFADNPTLENLDAASRVHKAKLLEGGPDSSRHQGILSVNNYLRGLITQRHFRDPQAEARQYNFTHRRFVSIPPKVREFLNIDNVARPTSSGTNPKVHAEANKQFDDVIRDPLAFLVDPQETDWLQEVKRRSPEFDPTGKEKITKAYTGALHSIGMGNETLPQFSFINPDTRQAILISTWATRHFLSTYGSRSYTTPVVVPPHATKEELTNWLGGVHPDDFIPGVTRLPGLTGRTGDGTRIGNEVKVSMGYGDGDKVEIPAQEWVSHNIKRQRSEEFPDLTFLPSRKFATSEEIDSVINRVTGGLFKDRRSWEEGGSLPYPMDFGKNGELKGHRVNSLSTREQTSVNRRFKNSPQNPWAITPGEDTIDTRRLDDWVLNTYSGELPDPDPDQASIHFDQRSLYTNSSKRRKRLSTWGDRYFNILGPQGERTLAPIFSRGEEGRQVLVPPGFDSDNARVHWCAVGGHWIVPGNSERIGADLSEIGLPNSQRLFMCKDTRGCVQISNAQPGGAPHKRPDDETMHRLRAEERERQAEARKEQREKEKGQ